MTEPRDGSGRKPRNVNKSGAHGRAVAANLRRLREARGISTLKLAQRLRQLGRHIQPAALTRIELGDRQPNVDDVFVLAVALGVSPTALMMPFTAEGNVEIEGVGQVPAREAWAWVDGRAPLADQAAEDYEETFVDHQMHSRPRGLRNVIRKDPFGAWLVYTSWDHDQETGLQLDHATNNALTYANRAERQTA